MSEFLRKIQKSSESSIHNQKEYTATARVTSTDEINNLCSVEFIDKDGYKSNKDNVQVKIYAPGFIGWFPKEGDLVNVQVADNRILITSAYEQGYASAHRGSHELKKDIYSSSFGGTVNGNII